MMDHPTVPESECDFMEILDVWNDVYPFAGIGCAGSFCTAQMEKPG